MLGPVIEGQRIRLYASRKALERVGCRQCGRRRRHQLVDGTWHDMWMGEILKEDWERLEGQAR